MKRIGPKSPWLVCGVLLALLVVLFGASLCAGRVWAPWSAWVSHGQDPRWAIVFGLRLPRTILAILVGGALGLSGAALQGYTRNPLADPAALGVSTAAALGAVLTLYLGAAGEASWILPVAAMVEGGGRRRHPAGPGRDQLEHRHLPAGRLRDPDRLRLGHRPGPEPGAQPVGGERDRQLADGLPGRPQRRGGSSWPAPGVIAGGLLLLTLGRSLDALTLGEQGARSLGVDLSRTRLLMAAGVAVAVGSSVAVTGVISFVGLITPHLLRPLLGAKPSASAAAVVPAAAP
ncbi:FecCD family ABC transporter permease [Caulobacter segnis]